MCIQFRCLAAKAEPVALVKEVAKEGFGAANTDLMRVRGSSRGGARVSGFPVRAQQSQWLQGMG